MNIDRPIPSPRLALSSLFRPLARCAFWLVTLAYLAAAPGRGATINWGTPTTIAGDGDVSATGTFVAAYHATPPGGSSATVNAVTFQALPIQSGTGGPFTAGSFTISGSANFFTNSTNSSTGNPFAGLSANYKAMLDTPAYSGAAYNVRISNLISGTRYQVQVWVDYSANVPFPTTVTATAGNSVALNINTANASGGLGQWVTGTFTADASTQDITFAGSNVTTYVNAVQVRLLESPTLLVSTLNDVSAADGQTSLREAMLYANGLGTPANISFNIPGGGTIALQAQNAAGARMLPILTNPNGVTINGSNSGQGAIAIDGGSTSNTTGDRVFFLGLPDNTPAAGGGTLPSTRTTNWAISHLTIRNGNARGGRGGMGNNGGGGGAGLGGAIFVNAGNLTLSDVAFTGNRAIGGNGGGTLGAVNAGRGGGGGMGGNGGDAVLVANGGGSGGGGGFGLGADGGNAPGGTGQSGGFSSGASAGNGGNGQAGGLFGGGGGAGALYSGTFIAGGGGGGVGGGNASNGVAGAGGFGGGSGGSGASLGAMGGFGGGSSDGVGGFGGGGGSNSRVGGFGGGAAGSTPGMGGGGLGAGGAVFVRQGASLSINNGAVSGGLVQGGTGANSGQGIGSGVFLAGSASWDVSTGNTVTLADTLGGGTDPLITGGFTKSGAGTLVLSGTNNYTGGTTITGGTLRVDGQIAGTTTVSGSATLAGSGTVGSVNVSANGTISPGTSTGALRTGAVTFVSGAQCNVDLAGSTAGSGYDQIDATGDVALAGATLNLTASPGIVAGVAMRIVQTTGNLTGTFQGRPDGAAFTVGGRPCVIRYFSNMVTLTASIDNLARLQADASFDLFTATGQPTGSGTFSGPGVSGSNFSPGAGVGVKTITFTPTSGSPVTFTITVTESASLVVTTRSDTVDSLDGVTSLREAMLYANSFTDGLPHTVTFSNTTANGAVNFHDGTMWTITLGGSELTIDNAINVEGPGADRLTVSGNNVSRVFSVSTTGTARLNGLTITGGNGTGAVQNNYGGAILNRGTLTVFRCAITGNSAAIGGGAICAREGASTPITTYVIDSLLSSNSSNSGGGIFSNYGYFYLINSTVANNNGPSGGGVVGNGGIVVAINSTLAGNIGAQAGGVGGIYATGFQSRNTIIAGNSGQRPDIMIPFESFGYNLIGDTTGSSLNPPATGDLRNVAANLGTLANNGGPTATAALLAGSAAINAGSSTVSEIQSVTVRGSAGTFTLTVGGQTTPALAYNTSAATVQTALQNLSTVGTGNVEVNYGGGTFTLHYRFGARAETNVPDITASGTGGATVQTQIILQGGNLTTDQRGKLRPQFSLTDIGAYELTAFDTGQTIVTTGGASWYVGPPAAGSNLRVYREVAGQTPVWVDNGAALRIGKLNDGTVVVQTASGDLYARIGSASGIGTSWQILTTKVVAGDGATWFLSTEPSNVNDRLIYRWGTDGTLAYSDGAGSQLAVLPDGSIVTRIFAGASFHRVGSSSGLGTTWRILSDSLVVTTAADEDNGTSDPSFGAGTSLREAISYANGKANADANTPDEITFNIPDAQKVSGIWTIAVASGLPRLDDDVTITGPGASLLTLKEAGMGGTVRLLDIFAGETLVLSGLTLENSNTAVTGLGGSLRMSNCTLRGNGTGMAPYGPAVVINCLLRANQVGMVGDGSLTVINSTLSENSLGIACATDSTTNIINSTVSGNARGIDVARNSTVNVSHCTVSGNDIGIDIQRLPVSVTLKNSICAGNTTANVTSGFIDGGYNLTSGDPKLGPLQENGGPTPTHALLPDSPALDAGDPAFDPNAFTPPLTTDQRGEARVAFGRVDIGAYESSALRGNIADTFFVNTLPQMWDVLANDRTVLNGTLTITGVTQPTTGGTVAIIGGMIRYTPPRGSLRTGSFTYTVSNGNTSQTVTVTLATIPAGTYIGLLRREDQTIRGRVSTTVTATGVMSASIRYEGRNFAAVGSIPNRQFRVTGPAPVPKPVTVSAGELDAAGQRTLVFSLPDSIPGQFLTGIAERAVSSPPQAGQYTMLSSLPSGGTGPATSAALTCTITPAGAVTFGGKLGSSVAVTYSARLLHGGRLPFYFSRGNGNTLMRFGGELVFDRSLAPAVTGTLRWTCPSAAMPRVPGGVDEDYEVLGLPYTRTQRATTMFSPTVSNATLTLSAPSLGSASPYTRPLALGVGGLGVGLQKVPLPKPGAGFVLFSTARGYFSGESSLPGVPKRTFFGVVLQGGGVNEAHGIVLDTNTLSPMSITPVAPNAP